MRLAQRSGPVPRPETIARPEMPAASLARRPLKAAFAFALALAAVCGAAAPAAAVQVTCGNGAGLAGQLVDITLSTGNLTGLGITSLQFEITYNASVVTAVGVSEAGTSTGTAGWGNATFNTDIGKVTVSDAGTSPLTGSGPLIKVQFLINPAQLGASASTLGLSSTSFVFNEGSPVDTCTGGTLTINATPIITVSPNSGEVIRGQTLQFTVSGSVSAPVSWFTTNAAIATISATGLLTGQAPGQVRVYAVDNAARRDTTDSVIDIRGMGLTAGSGSVLQGLTIDVPITVTSLTGLGIRAGQVSLSFNANLLAAQSVQAPAGTLLHNYGPTAFGASGGTCTVDFVGSGDLAGSGVLCYVRFLATSLTSGGSTLAVTQALFNETLPAKTTGGFVTVTTLPTITVNPDSWIMLAGETRQFTLTGGPTPPVTWTTLDPSVATISSTGLLTAVAGGVTQVRALDSVGATDLNTSVTVYDFEATLATVSAPPGATVRVPLRTDRALTPLEVRALQYRVAFSTTQILSAQARPLGLVGLWGPGGLEQNYTSGALQVATAGADPLGAGNNEIQVLEFTLSPSVTVGTNLPLTLTGVLFNEGRPIPRVVNGMIQVRTSTDVAGEGALSFALGACEPNPARGGTRIPFAIPAGSPPGSRVRLDLFGLDGRVVRTLLDEPASPGRRSVQWDGRDRDGTPVAAGVYFYRLSYGARSQSRKLAVTR